MNPLGQRQLVAPTTSLKLPAGQGVQEDAPAALEKVPAGHSVGLTEEAGQKEPAGHSTGEPEEQ